jgi:hypothetical protein
VTIRKDGTDGVNWQALAAIITRSTVTINLTPLEILLTGLTPDPLPVDEVRNSSSAGGRACESVIERRGNSITRVVLEIT